MMWGMAAQKVAKGVKRAMGPQPKSAEERTTVQILLPVSLADRMRALAKSQNLSRSDFGGWLMLHALNDLLAKNGHEPVPLPEYLEEIHLEKVAAPQDSLFSEEARLLAS